MEWFGVDLGSIWGSVWGQDRFGVTLGSIWAQFGVHLGDLGVFAQMRKEMWLSWTGFVSARTNNSTPAPGPAPSAIANHTPSAFARRPPSASNADGRAVFNALLKGVNPLAVLKSIRLALPDAQCTHSRPQGLRLVGPWSRREWFKTFHAVWPRRLRQSVSRVIRATLWDGWTGDGWGTVGLDGGSLTGYVLSHVTCWSAEEPSTSEP